ncbi:MAG TPA: hypothetical protein VIM63_15775 [Rhodoferax sp.]
MKTSAKIKPNEKVVRRFFIDSEARNLHSAMVFKHDAVKVSHKRPIGHLRLNRAIAHPAAHPK